MASINQARFSIPENEIDQMLPKSKRDFFKKKIPAAQGTTWGSVAKWLDVARCPAEWTFDTEIYLKSRFPETYGRCCDEKARKSKPSTRGDSTFGSNRKIFTNNNNNNS
jgi:hypothetical protein